MKFILIAPARNKARSGQRQVHVLEVKAGNIVSQLEKCVPILQPRDFGIHHERLDLTIHAEVSTRPRAVEVRLLHALDLNLSNRIADPLCRLGFRRLEKDFGGRLRQHDLGQMAIDHLKLRLPLEAEHKRVPALPVLRNCGMQLGQAL